MKKSFRSVIGNLCFIFMTSIFVACSTKNAGVVEDASPTPTSVIVETPTEQPTATPIVTITPTITPNASTMGQTEGTVKEDDTQNESRTVTTMVLSNVYDYKELDINNRLDSYSYDCQFIFYDSEYAYLVMQEIEDEYKDMEYSLIKYNLTSGKITSTAITGIKPGMIKRWVCVDDAAYVLYTSSVYLDNNDSSNPTFFVGRLDKDGCIRDSVCVDSFIKNERSQDSCYVFPKISVDDKNIYFIDTYGNVITTDLSGESISKTKYSEEIPFKSVKNVFPMKDGKVLIAYIEATDSSEVKGVIYDCNSRTVVFSCIFDETSQDCMVDPYSCCVDQGDETYAFYFANEEGVYGFRMDTQSSEMIISSIDSDCVYYDLFSVAKVNDGFICSTWDFDIYSRYYMYHFTEKDVEDTASKQIITVGGVFLWEDNLRSAVAEFNKNNSEYRIVLVVYSDKEFDYQKAASLMIDDIKSGNGAVERVY